MDRSFDEYVQIQEAIVSRLKTESFLISETLSVYDRIHHVDEYSFEDILSISESLDDPPPISLVDALEIFEIKTMTPAIRNYIFTDTFTLQEYNNHYLNV